MSLYKATTFRILIQDEIKLCCLQVKCPQRMFWKVCTRCECVSLCSSGQSWQCMNKKSINIDRSQSIRNCRPCKGQIDQMIRTRNFKVRDERVVTGVLVETPKGKNVGVERRRGECYQWKAKGQCSKGDAYSFRREDNQRGKKSPSSSAAPRSQTQNDG